MLPLLKVDLMISTTALDDYLAQLVEAAMEYIATEGITLGNTPGDIQLVEMYAAYLYRKRRETAGGGMPRALRWALNNRLMGGGADG